MRIALEVSCQLIFADVDKLTFEVVWKDWAGQIEVLYDEWAICCTQVPETLDLEHRKESLRIPLCLHLINIFLHICQRIMPSDMIFYLNYIVFARKQKQIIFVYRIKSFCAILCPLASTYICNTYYVCLHLILSAFEKENMFGPK